MCRFALYLGPEISVASLVTEPENSIIHQSFQSHEREEPLNGDGFGIAWYVPELSLEPAIFRDVSPAWSNVNLHHLAPVTRSRCLLAHVRAATPGLPVTQLNCHPFAWGPFALMHNGHVAGFARLRRKIQQGLSDEAYQSIQGSTDSEHVLALFRDRYVARRDGDPLERMIDALLSTIADLEALREAEGTQAPSLFNLALTDGERAVVTRYISRDPERANSLHLLTGRSFACHDGRCSMGRAEGGAVQAVLVCSEPLTSDPGWRNVPPNHLVAIGAGPEVEVRPIELP